MIKGKGTIMNKKKIALVITALIPVLLLSYAVFNMAAEWYRLRPVLGNLTGPAHAMRLENRNFILTWDHGNLKILSRRNPVHILFENEPGKSFVAGALGRENVEESRGSFFLRDTIIQVFSRQMLDALYRTDSGDFILEGTLTDEDTGSSIGYILRFSEADNHSIRFSLDFPGGTVNRSYLTLKSHKDEKLFGFGVQFTQINMKGRYLPILVMEQGIGRGRQPLTAIVNLVAKAGGNWYTSYAAVPHLFSSDLRSLHLDTGSYSAFDMRYDERIQITAFTKNMRGTIIEADTPRDLIARYTNLTGRMRSLPEWVHRGAIIGIQGGTEKVRAIYEKLKEINTPIAAFWLQDWEGQRKTSFGKQLWWNWQLDKKRYPNWPMLHEDFKKLDIPILGYINPFLVDTKDAPERGRNLYREAIEHGYMVRTPDGKPYLIPNTDFSAILLDLTNPKAVEWMKNIIRTEMAGTGMRGWMADFAEALPWDAMLFSGEKAADLHNRYPELWARLNREVIDSLPGSREYLFFSRSGYTKSPAWSTLFWLGDQMVTWDEYDGIKSAVIGMLSSGFSGYSLQHSDIGGYTALTSPVLKYLREKELLLRWIELNAFSPVFRTHEGNRPDENFQFYNDDETLQHFSRFAKVYEAWGFYRKELVEKASQTGLPVIRHLYLEYPHDNNVADLRYECFMIGSELLMAPVTEKGETKVWVYLPAGKWRHLWSGKAFTSKGEWFDIDAPIGNPAVFFREGSSVGGRLRRNLAEWGLLTEQTAPHPG
ncbi:MAG: alpha-glucosidase [Spirochaetae bacterium HGW-Spirochaetae-1]|jgi:alpha-glucosidase|nr:MAG: alpha-glucosidase [Spirochaetae bacterium HGW-Spirochaetae-1]